MDITVKELRCIAKDYLLSSKDVQETYTNLLDDILDAAKEGKTDLIVYLHTYENQDIIWSALKALELDEFRLIPYRNTTIITISWGFN